MTETVVPEVEPVADAAVEVDGHVVGVAEEPAVEAEAITVENEPAEVRTEFTEVPDTIHLHGTLQWTLCMSVLHAQQVTLSCPFCVLVWITGHDMSLTLPLL